MENLNIKMGFRIYHTEFVCCGYRKTLDHELGCSGTHHAIVKNILYYDGDRKTDSGRSLPSFAKTVSGRIIGKCDGTCGPKDLGGFLLDID